MKGLDIVKHLLKKVYCVANLDIKDPDFTVRPQTFYCVSADKNHQPIFYVYLFGWRQHRR